MAWVPPNEQFQEGGLISCGVDSLVLVWDLATGEIVQTLKGHREKVTGVAWDGSDVVSASVDCTIRRWNGELQVEVWEAHKAPIQAVRALPLGELITGSSDSTIKLWAGSKCTHTFTGHTDTVRGFAFMPDLGILSASHDGSIRLWALTGEVLLEMVGHTAIVYSVDAHKSGLVASGSEDGSAKIWKDGVCVQSIDHPGCVCDVKFLENGDIVTACSDGVARVWTPHQERTAESHELEAYASLLSQYKGIRKRVGGLKLDVLSGLEALQAPGTREGDNGVASSLPDDVIGRIIQNHLTCLKHVVRYFSVSRQCKNDASSIEHLSLIGDHENGSSAEKAFHLPSHIGLQKCVGIFDARKFEPIFERSTCHILLSEFYICKDRAISAFRPFQFLRSLSLRFPVFRRHMEEAAAFFYKCDFKEDLNLLIFLSPLKITPPQDTTIGRVVVRGFFDEAVETLPKKLHDDYLHCFTDVVSRSSIMRDLVSFLPKLTNLSITGTDPRKLGNLHLKGDKLRDLRLWLQLGDCSRLHQIPEYRIESMDVSDFIAPQTGYSFSGVKVFVSVLLRRDPISWEELFNQETRGDDESLTERAYMELLRYVVDNGDLLRSI